MKSLLTVPAFVLLQLLTGNCSAQVRTADDLMEYLVRNSPFTAHGVSISFKGNATSGYSNSGMAEVNHSENWYNGVFRITSASTASVTNLTLTSSDSYVAPSNMASFTCKLSSDGKLIVVTASGSTTFTPSR